MIVGRSSIEQVLVDLRASPCISLDTETTGLRPFHGDRLFSIVLATEKQTYYLNFQPYPGLEPDKVLLPETLESLRSLLEDPSKTWYLHNAKYDLHILAQEGLRIAGTVHCTRAIGRIEYNEHLSYSLDACAKRIGLEKSDEVEKYVIGNDLWEWETVPGKKTRSKRLHFQKVPFDIISRYGEKDARITFDLARSQETKLEGLIHATPKGLPHLGLVLQNERRLTKTIFGMEKYGIQIDRDYCNRAALYETARAARATEQFQVVTGREFKSSPKLFSEVFEAERALWQYTEKNNPSFESDVLETFSSPAAKLVLEYRDAKSKSDFYYGFLYHADSHGVIHPNFNQDGTATGRFSSSEPNFQNLTKEEGKEDQEFVVRRAIVPRPGHLLISCDMDQVEYRLMIDYAGEKALADKIVKEGLDVHQATADMMGVTRTQAKTINFMLLYGGGAQKLADALGVSLQEAQSLKARYFATLPNVRQFVQAVTRTAEVRGYTFNWLGRRCHYPDPRFAYKAPNYLIQGGCADIMKVAMNRIDEYLSDKRSKMIMTVHDEVVVEVHEDEAHVVPKKVQEIVGSSYEGKILPLTAGVAYSRRSLADLTEGLPA